MAVTLTESAAKHVQGQIARRGAGLGLRVGVKRVGCSGYAYTLDYADEVRPDDRVARSTDLRFGLAGLGRRRLAEQADHQRSGRDHRRGQQHQQNDQPSTQ